MDDNYFRPPESNIETAKQDIPKYLKRILLLTSVIAILFTGLSAIVFITEFYEDISRTSINQASFFPVYYVSALVLLSYGVCKKNRIAAIFMFLLFVISLFGQIKINGGYHPSSLLTIICIFVFFINLVFTYKYHNLNKHKALD